MSEKLKPCPFCGSDNVHITRTAGSLHDETGSFYYVSCSSCCAKSGSEFSPGGRYTNDLYKAVCDRWNKRAN
ncbi:hypothetical protein SOASR030_01770 [Leminorella grimontii]|uniref:Restriction alleviation protein, Lar family n=1 Tax=Leminorella grimontii TaxID=82981 RepID=A0AAV5MXM6_9GAMM|nr:hypothetical protein SOASR030_01770 [Leminorella grimontii]